MRSEPLVLKRYRLERPLGQGGAGIVYRAHDVELDRRVALKVLHSLGADQIFRLKKEFRSLAELTHPNLVELYDLVADGEQWFFTMELIEGQNFVDAFRNRAGAPGLDYEQLRDAIRQLVAALDALHAHRKLHRDIKPTNVLVEATGRVVVVDFGLVINELSRSSQASNNSVHGTLAYMAPEQMWGNVSAASDWYGVGAMLYETLTGTLPFTSEDLRAIFSGQSRTAKRARELAPETPADLDDLVSGLLRRRPEERPDPKQVLARLTTSRRVSTPDTVRTADGKDTRLVGRGHELARLQEVFTSTRHGLRVVVVDGPSGIGKTALVEHFLDELESLQRTVVLRARCHPRESVPFKAVDGLIDDLTRFLCRQAAATLAQLLPEDSAVVPRLFPVFGRVAPPTPLPAGEPHEIRRRAFAAVREILVRVADRYPTVAWIDDLQWGDLDSAALIRAVIRQPAPPKMLLGLSARDGEDEHEVIRELCGGPEPGAGDGELVRLHLSALSEKDARELAAELLANDSEAAAVAADAGGNPLIIGELARHHTRRHGTTSAAGSIRFADMVAARIERLPEGTQRLLQVVSLAGGPVTERLLYRFAESTAEVVNAVSELRRQCLIRPASQAGEAALETYHHRVGETVSALLGADRSRALHREIADALERMPDANPQQLVEHFIRAGDVARAGEHAYASAEKAVAAMAFHGAARLYRQALQLGTHACPPWQLNAKLGDALIAAGRSGEGATCLAAAARELGVREPANLEVLRLKRRAAEYYLRGGLHAEGLVVLQEVLSATRLRYGRSVTTALLSLIGNRMRVALRRRLQINRPATELSGFARERLEACWSAGVGLSLFDQMRAAAFQARHALLAHRAGDRAHLARALATEGFILAWEGGSRKQRRAQQLRHAGARLAQRADDASIRAHGVLMSAVSAYYEFRLREALDLCAEGERLCREECVGAGWELANLQVLTGNTLACLGELARLRAHFPEMMRQARERDDRYCLVIGRLGYGNLFWLAADRADEARVQVEEALAGPFPSTFAWQLYQGALAQAQIDLYVGDGVGGWNRMFQAWNTLRRHMMLRFQTTRVEMRYLSARCALLRAKTEIGNERGRMLRFAARSARRIEAEDAPWVEPFANALRAGVLAARGERENAAQRLEEAALGFDELDMALHASAARYQVSVLRGGDSPGMLQAREEAWMRERGVANPARIANMLAPGV